MKIVKKHQINIKPIICYPKVATAGKSYVMSIDFTTNSSGENWPFNEEEYSIYCSVEAGGLFRIKNLGEPVIVLHRFGGTYGAVTFLLTALKIDGIGDISIDLFSVSGFPIWKIILNDILVKKHFQNKNLSTLQSMDANLHATVVSEHLGDVQFYKQAPSPIQHWVQRSEVYHSLTSAYINTNFNTFILDGIGGVGKSSVVRRWIDEILQLSSTSPPPQAEKFDEKSDQILLEYLGDLDKPDGVFWWSFYSERKCR